jgi:hypothetical protein
MSQRNFCLHTDADPEARHVSGTFRFDRENGLSFTCHSLEHDYELTKLTLLALQEHIEQQLKDEPKCPFSRAALARTPLRNTREAEEKISGE